MQLFETVMDVIKYFLYGFSILILLWGAANAFINFFKIRLQKSTNKETIKSNTYIKIEMGSYVLLSLEILIAADIIDSILKPTFEDIFRLGAVVLIRTIISFFLTKEIKETSDVTSEIDNLSQKKDVENV